MSLPTKPTTPYHIRDVVNIPLRSEWYDSFFLNMRKWQYTEPSVHRLYAHHYHHTQRYSDPEYMLGQKQLKLTTNMNYNQEHVQMVHPCLK